MFIENFKVFKYNFIVINSNFSNLIKMADPKKLIPVIPSAFLPDNVNAIDWGACGMACFATGSTINFFEIIDGKINRLYSHNFKVSEISALKFHSINRIMAFGDTLGNLLFWDVERRGAICSILPYAMNAKCLDICWKGNSVIALFSNNHLVSLCLNSNINTENQRRMEIQWEIQLKEKYSHVSFDPNPTGYILLSCNEPQFSVYEFKPGDSKPKPFYEYVELSCPDKIQDIQWSQHFPGFIWVVLKNEIVFFHINSKTLIPMIRQRTSASSFAKLFQFHDEYKKFIVFHRNGLLTIFQAKDKLNYVIDKEIQPKHCSSQVIKVASNPMSSKELFLVYSNLGPALYNIDKEKAVTSCFNFPIETTAIDYKEDYYAVGTATGNIILYQYASFDFKGIKNYKVSDTPVDFVGLSMAIHKIFFKCKSQIGEIRLDTHEVVIFSNRSLPARRCFSTSLGAFIVQRDTHILGIFVNGREMPALLSSDIVDLSIKESISGPSTGELAVLLKSKDIYFLKYDPDNGVKFLSSKFSIRTPVNPVSICVSTKQMIIAFDNGNLLTHSFTTKKTSSSSIIITGITSMRFCNDILFGLCFNGTTLFCSDGNNFRQCPLIVTSFVPVSSSLVFVINDDHIARFLRVSDWHQIIGETEMLLPMPNKERIAYHIEHHPLSLITNEALSKTNSEIAVTIGSMDGDNNEENKTEELPKHDLPELSLEGFGLETPWFHPDSRDIWLMLREDDQVPLSLQCHTGAGSTGCFEQVIACLDSMVQYITPEFLPQKFSAALFANDYDGAAQILIQDNTVQSDLMKNATLSGCVIACSENPPEKLVIHLKAVAIQLFLQNSFEDGAILLRMAKLDHVAADYLLDHDQLEFGLKFIRACIYNKDEKNALLLKLGSKFFEKGLKDRAMRVFAACSQWHLALWILKSTGRIPDSFFIKKYLVYRGLLRPISPELQKSFPDILPLIDLIAQIDIDFAEFATNAGVSPQSMKALLG